MSQQVGKALMEDILKSAPVGVLIMDEAEYITWINQVLADLLGVSAEALMGKHRNDLPQAYLSKLLSGEDVVNLPPLNGQPERWLKHWHQVHTDEAGRQQQVRYYMDISEYIRSRDPLTGLLNFRPLLQALQPQVSRCRRYDSTLSVVVMEFEGLTAFDDKYGPASREQALKAISGLLKDQLRWADIIGQTTDMEFIIALPESDQAAAAKLVDKLRAAIADMKVEMGEGVEISLIPHFGIAEWTKNDDTRRLLERAQQAAKTGNTTSTAQFA